MRSSATLLGSQIGDYQLVAFLGAGGMGEVYRAVHTQLNRPAAVKVLPRMRGNETFAERFRNEARIQADLRHPNIATLYDFVEHNGRLCIIMEYVDGQSLHERIYQTGRMAPGAALSVFRKVVEALDYTHRKGVIHRDIKPQNIKISGRGEVKLLDFGIAKNETTPGLTAAGAVVGTPEYLSPEQLRGKPADPRTDVWALGVLLYEMLTGQVPFEAPSLIDLYKKIDEATYRRPSSLAPGVAPGLEAIISRCLQKRPANRYQNAGAVLRDVQQAMNRESAYRAPAMATELIPAMKPVVRPKNRLTALLDGQRLLTSLKQHGPYYLLGVALLMLLIVVVTVRPWEGAGGDPPPEDPTSQEAVHTISIDVFGAPAEVWQNGRRLGVTPYDFQAPLGEHVELVLKREGYRDKRLPFDVSASMTGFTESLERK